MFPPPTGKVDRVDIISYERKTPNLRYFYIQMLTEKCSSVRTISILNSPLISDTGLKYLTTFRRLQKIQIEGNACTSLIANCLLVKLPFMFELHENYGVIFPAIRFSRAWGRGVLLLYEYRDLFIDMAVGNNRSELAIANRHQER